MKKKLSHQIVICVHKDTTNVDPCLRSLVSSLETDEEIVVLLESDAPTETLENVKQMAAMTHQMDVILFDQCQQWKHIFNLALEHTSSEIITLIKANTLFSKGWSKKILHLFKRWSHVAAISPLSNANCHQIIPSKAAFGKSDTCFNHIDDLCLEEVNTFCESTSKEYVYPYVPLLSSLCFSFRRRVVTSLGGFDEVNFPLVECSVDDLILRLKHAGYTAVVAIDTYVHHLPCTKLKVREFRRRLMAGLESLCEKHGITKVDNAFQYMRENPSLVGMRAAIENRFHSKARSKSSPSSLDSRYIAVISPLFRASSLELRNSQLSEASFPQPNHQLEIHYHLFECLEKMYAMRWKWHAVIVQANSLNLQQAKRLRRLCDQYRSHLIYEVEESRLLFQVEDSIPTSPDPRTQTTRYLIAIADGIILAKSEFSYDFNIPNKKSKRVRISIIERLNETLPFLKPDPLSSLEMPLSMLSANSESRMAVTQLPDAEIPHEVLFEYDDAVLFCASREGPLFQFP